MAPPPPPGTRIPSPTKQQHANLPTKSSTTSHQQVNQPDSSTTTSSTQQPTQSVRPAVRNATGTSSSDRNKPTKPPVSTSSARQDSKSPALTTAKSATSTQSTRTSVTTSSRAGSGKNTPEKIQTGNAKPHLSTHTRNPSNKAPPRQPPAPTTTSKPPTTKQPPRTPQQPRSTPSKPPTKPAFTTTSTQSTPQKPQSHKPPPNPTHTRAQLHLLHLSLLHAECPQTTATYLQSAATQLSTRYAALAALYKETLHLARQHRQAANLLALHAWTGGNAAALSRKVNVLTGILAELMRLTAPEPANGEGEHAAEENGGVQAGEFTRFMAAFEEWGAWVRSVWAARDELAAAGEQGAGSGVVVPEAEYTAIEGVGDAAKASARTLAAQLNALHLRLQDVEAGTAEAMGAVVDAVNGEDGQDEQGGEGAQLPTPTPVYLLSAARKLVAGMIEELQIMREVEFEVVVGEKAWVEERVRRIGEAIEGNA